MMEDKLALFEDFLGEKEGAELGNFCAPWRQSNG